MLNQKLRRQRTTKAKRTIFIKYRVRLRCWVHTETYLIKRDFHFWLFIWFQCMCLYVYVYMMISLVRYGCNFLIDSSIREKGAHWKMNIWWYNIINVIAELDIIRCWMLIFSCAFHSFYFIFLLLLLLFSFDFRVQYWISYY